MSEVTRILSQMEQGDPEAAEQLLPLVYHELRKLAARLPAASGPASRGPAWPLVHEAYVRLVGDKKVRDPSSESLCQPRRGIDYV